MAAVGAPLQPRSARYCGIKEAGPPPASGRHPSSVSVTWRPLSFHNVLTTSVAPFSMGILEAFLSFPMLGMLDGVMGLWRELVAAGKSLLVAQAWMIAQ